MFWYLNTEFYHGLRHSALKKYLFKIPCPFSIKNPFSYSKVDSQHKRYPSNNWQSLRSVRATEGMDKESLEEEECEDNEFGIKSQIKE